METMEYTNRSLRYINTVFLIITGTLLGADLLVYHEHYYFHSSGLTILILLIIIGILVFSFHNKFKINYRRMLYSTLMMVTILTTVVAYLADHNRFFSLHILMLMICILSSLNRKSMKTFISIYVIATLPFVLIIQVDFELRIVKFMTMIVVLFLIYLKSQYDYNFMNAYKNCIQSKNIFLENAKEAFALNEMIFDEQGTPINYRYINVNPAFEELTGFKKSEVVGKTVLDIFPNAENYWISFFGSIVLDKEQKQMTNYSRESGRFYEVSAYPVEENKFVVLFVDVTEKIQQDRKLKYAVKRSEKADMLKTQFLRDVNHRLRTPLNGMMGMLQLINVAQIGEENRELFDAMVMEMRHCRNIINQIAKYVDIQGMDFEFSRNNIIDLIKSEVNKYDKNKVNIQLHIKEILEITEAYIEKNVLLTVFSEILSNAIKYTQDDNVEICIHCGWNAEETTHFYRIEVIDCGLGISKDRLEYIFNEFYHHDFINIYREDEKVSVPMCKQMLLSSGGDLLVDSSVGKGTKFTIILPIYIN
jgi:PAS domain S-box-containing protein